MSYNDWTNRETWLVNVWFNPESKEDVHLARNMIEQQYDDMENSIIKDMLNISLICWDELESKFDDKNEE